MCTYGMNIYTPTKNYVRILENSLQLIVYKTWLYQWHTLACIFGQKEL